MSRDLYRSVLRGSPCEAARDLSPMSNLAYTLHNATLAISTPRRKLSLSSNMSDTPQSCHNVSTSSLPSTSLLQDSSSDSPGGGCFEDALLSPTRRMAPSRNKENYPSPYYSPSRTHSTIPPRTRASPLQEVQNTVNRNLSFSSPRKKNLQMVSPSKRLFTSPQKPSPPDDFDTNSQDSGYSESGKKIDDDCFSVPISCAPRKLNLDSPPKPKDSPMTISTSPKACISTTTSTPTSSGLEGRTPFRKFYLPKGDEEDAMLMDLMQEESSQDEPVTGFANLLSAPIQITSVTLTTTQAPTTIPARPSIRRCLSMVDTTPTTSRVQSVCRAADIAPTITSFKRPEPPLDTTSQDCKRRKLEERPADSSPVSSSAPATTANKQTSPLTQRQISAPEPSSSQVTRPKLVRCHSESHVSIMKALNKSSGQVDLIGDFSKPLLLPTIEGGKHPDLKSISVETMAGILRGEYKKKIASCRVVDCRYPYEFEGGHIMGAEMWHHPEMVAENLESKIGAPVVKNAESPRDIIIFHCEFSAERGPKAQRLLREMDRKTNKEHYPALHFPEMYLMEGGYKAFYEKYPKLCHPTNYVRMLDVNHADDFKHFRGKSKSWAAENKQSKNRATGQPRPGLKRLGL